ncbi:MAG: ABC transporter ATP-binding protein [Austwickia sp.]|jgi:ABC-2 type transport system ATP-binding protein|nr:MAG: ABC transporter ATP-binding protein [Austwickia sp.]
MTSPVLDWRANLERDLHAAGLPRRVAVQLSNDAQAEADDAGRDPADLYGPASAYAAALARSVRATEPARTAGLNRPSPDLTGPVVLRVTEVSKRYGRRLVLSPVSFTLRAGQIAAIVGANGSGKSTLLDICAGATRASTGRVARTARLGYVPQHGGLAPLLTVGEHLRLFAAARGMPAAQAVPTGERLAAQLGWRPEPKARVGTLSGGTQQKLNVVLGELDRPDLILLDEPYQGFDQESYLDFWEQVFAWRDAGAGVVVVTHLLSSLREVDRVIELRVPGP